MMKRLSFAVLALAAGPAVAQQGNSPAYTKYVITEEHRANLQQTIDFLLDQHQDALTLELVTVLKASQEAAVENDQATYIERQKDLERLQVQLPEDRRAELRAFVESLPVPQLHRTHYEVNDQQRQNLRLVTDYLLDRYDDDATNELVSLFHAVQEAGSLNDAQNYSELVEDFMEAAEGYPEVRTQALQGFVEALPVPIVDTLAGSCSVICAMGSGTGTGGTCSCRCFLGVPIITCNDGTCFVSCPNGAGMATAGVNEICSCSCTLMGDPDCDTETICTPALGPRGTLALVSVLPIIGLYVLARRRKSLAA